MDSRWRNLLIVLFLVAIAAGVYWMLPLSAPRGEIDSFDAARASILATLRPYSWFNTQDQSITNPNESELADAKQELGRLRTEVQRAPSFSEKTAALSLFDAWISRLDLALAWKKIKDQARTATFSGTESDEQVCAQKPFFESLKQQASALAEKAVAAESPHNALVTGYATLASEAGFASQASTAATVQSAQSIAENVDEILGACP